MGNKASQSETEFHRGQDRSKTVARSDFQDKNYSLGEIFDDGRDGFERTANSVGGSPKFKHSNSFVGPMGSAGGAIADITSSRSSPAVAELPRGNKSQVANVAKMSRMKARSVPRSPKSQLARRLGLERERAEELEARKQHRSANSVRSAPEASSRASGQQQQQQQQQQQRFPDRARTHDLASKKSVKIRDNRLLRDDTRTLFVDKYRLLESIGKGAAGSVYKCEDMETGEIYAIKRISTRFLSSQDMKALQTEITLLSKMNHPNIVQYVETVVEEDHLNIVLEYVESGSLAQISKKFGGRFPESLVAIFIGRVLEGLSFLHAEGVIHRDIKCANILAKRSGVLKLADFGVATRTSDFTKQHSVVGTPYWMAPEIISIGVQSTACDIWSLGCVCIELLTGSPPYFDLQAMPAMFRIVQDSHPPLPEGSSDELRDFLLKCFIKEPRDRTSASELLKHRWLVPDESRQSQVETLAENYNGTMDENTAVVYGTIRMNREAVSGYMKSRSQGVGNVPAPQFEAPAPPPRTNVAKGTAPNAAGRCQQCGRRTPPGRFCIECGANTMSSRSLAGIQRDLPPKQVRRRGPRPPPSDLPGGPDKNVVLGRENSGLGRQRREADKQRTGSPRAADRDGSLKFHANRDTSVSPIAPPRSPRSPSDRQSPDDYRSSRGPHSPGGHQGHSQSLSDLRSPTGGKPVNITFKGSLRGRPPLNRFDSRSAPASTNNSPRTQDFAASPPASRGLMSPGVGTFMSVGQAVKRFEKPRPPSGSLSLSRRQSPRGTWTSSDRRRAKDVLRSD